MELGPGRVTAVELVPGGRDVPVTATNRQQYVELYVQVRGGWELVDSWLVGSLAPGLWIACCSPAVGYTHSKTHCNIAPLDCTLFLPSENVLAATEATFNCGPADAPCSQVVSSHAFPTAHPVTPSMFSCTYYINHRPSLARDQVEAAPKHRTHVAALVLDPP